MARIGFIGLGHMGLPMAMNLIKNSHTVTGFDLSPSAMKSLATAGGIPAKSVKEAAISQDVMITMLQKGAQVEDVCLGENGLFANAPKQSLFIDCSSIDVQQTRLIHKKAHECSLNVIDAPVSGGVAGAEKATLTFMVGGTDDAFKAAQPFLSVMGKKIIHTGAAGSGQAAKICNNMILGISMIAVSEAFVLAQQLGLSAEKLFEVVTNSSGQCWAISQYPPVKGLLENVPANNHYKPGFTAAMMLKDLNLSQQSAAKAAIKTPIAEQATALYQQLVDNNMGDLDFSAIIKLFDQK